MGQSRQSRLFRPVELDFLLIVHCRQHGKEELIDIRHICPLLLCFLLLAILTGQFSMADGVVFEESVVLFALLGGLSVQFDGFLALLALVSHFVLAFFEGFQSGLQIIWFLAICFLFVIARQTGQSREVQSTLHFPKTARLLRPVQLLKRFLQFFKFYFLEHVLLQFPEMAGHKFCEFVLFSEQIAGKKGYLLCFGDVYLQSQAKCPKLPCHLDRTKHLRLFGDLDLHLLLNAKLRADDGAVKVGESLLQMDGVCTVVEQCQPGDETITRVEDLHTKLLDFIAADEEGQGFQRRGFFHYYQ